MSASLAEVAPAVSTMLLGSKVTLYPRCSDMNLANACGNHAFSQSLLFICSIPGRLHHRVAALPGNESMNE